MLRPLDIVILLKIHCKKGEPWSQMSLAKELFISSRSVNEGLKRAALARLYSPSRKQIHTAGLEELLGAIRWLLPAHLGMKARGVPTSWGAPPLNKQIISSLDDLLPVWPTPDGADIGCAMEPLHPSVPQAARVDPMLYEALALVDALRGGRARERSIASEELSRWLRS